jgi:hypothetical protein
VNLSLSAPWRKAGGVFWSPALGGGEWPASRGTCLPPGKDSARRQVWGWPGGLLRRSGRFAGQINLLPGPGFEPRTRPVDWAIASSFSNSMCLLPFFYGLFSAATFSNLTQQFAACDVRHSLHAVASKPQNSPSYWAMPVFICLALGHAVHQLLHKITHEFDR